MENGKSIPEAKVSHLAFPCFINGETFRGNIIQRRNFVNILLNKS